MLYQRSRCCKAHGFFVRLCCVIIFCFPASKTFAKTEFESGMEVTRQSHEHAKRSQAKIDQYADKTREIVDEILEAERQLNMLDAYNIQLERLVRTQEDEATGLERQIDSIAETEQAMLPLLVVMIDRLSQLVASDLPFKLEQRNVEVKYLFNLIDRADVSVAEKYRQIIEAYENEVAYGRTIETYTGSLLGGQEQLQVHYLRIGRTALFQQSIDGSKGALWLPGDRRWKPLERRENINLTKAIQIALQQRVPELLELPLVARGN